MNFEGKRILVVGLARSGKAAVQALHKRGAWLTAFDAKPKTEIEENIAEIEPLVSKVYAGTVPQVRKEDFDLLVVSPGVPLDRQPVQQARDAVIPIISELELAYLLKSPEVEFYAVTGTNGKTTTTVLLHHILSVGGRNSAEGGNIGVALCSLVDSMKDGIIAVEASSFQLETTETFYPHICGILNITEDHLDRHKTMLAYIEAKAKIFRQQNEKDYAILNYDDELVRNLSNQAKSQILFFSTDQILSSGLFVQNGMICLNWQGHSQEICSLEGISLRGKHNLQNILCAVAMAWVAGIDAQSISSALKTFQGVRHRLEEVAEYRGILYINDSKGTNPDSTIMALNSFDRPIILIAGGRPKGGSYDTVAELISTRVRELVLLGEAKNLIKTAVLDHGFTNIHEVETFTEAVDTASRLAQSGDVVLLSPACASWDMFPSYEHRGDLFCELVQSIIAEN